MHHESLHTTRSRGRTHTPLKPAMPPPRTLTRCSPGSVCRSPAGGAAVGQWERWHGGGGSQGGRPRPTARLARGHAVLTPSHHPPTHPPTANSTMCSTTIAVSMPAEYLRWVGRRRRDGQAGILAQRCRPQATPPSPLHQANHQLSTAALPPAPPPGSLVQRIDDDARLRAVQHALQLLEALGALEVGGGGALPTGEWGVGGVAVGAG